MLKYKLYRRYLSLCEANAIIPNYIRYLLLHSTDCKWGHSMDELVNVLADHPYTCFAPSLLPQNGQIPRFIKLITSHVYRYSKCVQQLIERGSQNLPLVPKDQRLQSSETLSIHSLCPLLVALLNIQVQDIRQTRHA